MLKLSFKNGKYQTLDLATARITVGRDPSNDIVLEGEGISGFHAEFHVVFSVDSVSSFSW